MNAHFQNELEIEVDNVILTGDLFVPPEAESIVIFSHGSGSSRFSTRNKMVAQYLNKNNLGTLLFDLLTAGEDKNYYNRFDIELLAGRLVAVTGWLRSQDKTSGFQIAYFGASTGAASALKAAARLPGISAVVSRGGRPDLAGDVLETVEAPTLLIVGSLDNEVLKLNEYAYYRLRCEKKLVVVPGATHLFEEPGKMNEVSEIACEWFKKYLQPDASSFRKN